MIRIKSRWSQAGKVQSNFLPIFLLVVFVAGFYCAFKFGPPYYHDRNFEGFLNMQARNSFEWKNDLIEKNILEYAEQNGLNLRKGEWSVYRNDTHISLKVRYRTVIEIPFGLSRALRFEHDIKQEIKRLKEL